MDACPLEKWIVHCTDIQGFHADSAMAYMIILVFVHDRFSWPGIRRINFYFSVLSSVVIELNGRHVGVVQNCFVKHGVSLNYMGEYPFPRRNIYNGHIS